MSGRGWLPSAACCVALLYTLPAEALDTNDALEVRLIGGEVVEGWFVRVGDGTLVLSGDNRFEEVPLAAITAVTRDGVPLDLDTFRAEVEAIQVSMDAWRADPPPHPPPVVAAGVSLVWAGAGHAALGEWRTFAAYSVVECVLLGTIATNIYLDESPAVIVPIAALDLLFRGWSAGEAARLARRRRAKLDAPR